MSFFFHAALSPPKSETCSCQLDSPSAGNSFAICDWRWQILIALYSLVQREGNKRKTQQRAGAGLGDCAGRGNSAHFTALLAEISPVEELAEKTATHGYSDADGASAMNSPGEVLSSQLSSAAI